MFDFAKATTLWIALGASLGLYYRFSEGGGRGLLLSHPESFVAVLFHDSGKFDTLQPVPELVIWLAAMPAVGLAWVSVQTLLAKPFGGRRAIFSVSLVRSGMAAAPIAVLGLWLAVQAGDGQAGWHLSNLLDVMLGRRLVRPQAYMDYMYAGAGFIALAVELRLFWTAFDLRGNRAVLHVLASIAILLFVAMASGTAINMLVINPE